jgi:hypothetical protein
MLQNFFSSSFYPHGVKQNNNTGGNAKFAYFAGVKAINFFFNEVTFLLIFFQGWFFS